MLTLDGSIGEGGGQVLRTALALALVTGTPIRIEHVRARRHPPGLRPQHLAAVRAAAAISGAEVGGAALGAQTVTFVPGPLAAGDYRFDIGTAGAATLVLQTVLVPLALADAPSTVTVRGGTHVPLAPSAHFLRDHWCPMLARAGFRLSVDIERVGFYPRGGGLLRARTLPSAPAPLTLVERGPLQTVAGVSLAGRLPAHVAERQRRRVLERLAALTVPVEVREARCQTASPGSAVELLARHARSQAAVTALGRRGRPAERVADDAVDALEAFWASGAAVDRHLADQLVLPLALAPGRSRLTVEAVTSHLATVLALIERLLPVATATRTQAGAPAEVEIDSRFAARGG